MKRRTVDMAASNFLSGVNPMISQQFDAHTSKMISEAHFTAQSMNNHCLHCVQKISLIVQHNKSDHDH